jgi:4-amino-4-deoxy-L-arabinose transferase-like glycosyltransferase
MSVAITSTKPYGNFSVWLTRHIITTSLIVFFCSACPRVFFIWRTDPAAAITDANGYSDGGQYISLAQKLIERGAFVDEAGTPHIHRPPGYPAFLAAMLFFADQDLHRALIIQAVILSCGVLILYWLARRILPPVIAFTGSLLAAFLPWGIAFAGLPLSDGLFMALLALIFFTIKFVEEAYKLAAAMLGGACTGLFTGIAVLVRPVEALILLVAATLFLRYGPRRKGAWLVLTAMLVCSVAPVYLWRERNRHEMHFESFSDIPAYNAWAMLAARVIAQVNGQDKWAVHSAFDREARSWGLSVQEKNDEYWRRAIAIFREHPLLTIYCFIRSAAEHAIHPSPDVLRPAKLVFYGDLLVLALLWGGLLILAYLGWRSPSSPDWDDGKINRGWLLTILVVCLLLTLSSGFSFGNGSRLRLPLELIVPLLAAISLARIIPALGFCLTPRKSGLAGKGSPSI